MATVATSAPPVESSQVARAAKSAGRGAPVVERTLGWLSKCRGLLVRYEKQSENYLGLLQFACALYWYRRLPAAGPGSS
jgi:transposase